MTPSPLSHPLSRRRLLAGSAGAGLAATVGTLPCAHATTPLVDGGQAHAVVVTPDGASSVVTAAATDLVAYVAKSTGVSLPRVSVPSGTLPSGLLPVYVGMPDPAVATALLTEVAQLDRDGFVIHPTASSLTLLGASDWGTSYAVHEFLESHVGVGWLMPTTIGEDVPTRTTLLLPTQRTVAEPGLAQRMLSPLVVGPGASGPWPAAQYEWARRLRLQGAYNERISFHHHMASLFPPSLFADRPDLYSGNKVPTGSTGWQPVFTNPDTVTIAIQRICDHFAANPVAGSYSLGVNDGDGYDIDDLNDPRGLVDVYYDWVNQVVTGVAAQYPDKWFGLLAYSELADPPSFALHPKVVPFLTSDRLCWADTALRTTEVARNTTWAARASQLGWYDYPYGSPYLVPRIAWGALADSLGVAVGSGVVAYYGELYPNWGEGPKPWVLAKALWDPDLDVSAAVTEWCTRAVGVAAAPHLVAYFAVFDQFWSGAALSTEWFQQRSTFQAFNSATYLDAFPVALVETCRDHMDQVLAHPGTSAQQARAAKLAQAFDYYEASVRTHLRPVSAPNGTTAALDLLSGVETQWQARNLAAQHRLDLAIAVNADPLLLHMNKPVPTGLVWSGWNPADLWGIVDHLQAHEPSGGPVTTWLLARENPATVTEFTQFVRLCLRLAAGTSTSLLSNGSFEVGSAPWSFWVVPTNTMNISTAAAHSGTRSVATNGMSRGGPVQRITVGPGLIATRSWVFAPTGTPLHGTLQLNYNLRSSTTQIGILRGRVHQVSRIAGTWTAIRTLDLIPATVNGAVVAAVDVIPTLNGFNDDPPVFLDDVEAHRAP